MNFRLSKKDILFFAVILIVAILGTLLCLLTLRSLPNVISLDFLPSDTQDASGIEKAKDTFIYNSDISQIPKENVYFVHALGDDIYVSTKDSIVYKVKAKLSEFPDGDKKAICDEITAEGLSQLKEILSYLES